MTSKTIPVYNAKDIIPIIDENGKFLDFALKTGHPFITDYSQIKREIIVKDYVVTLGNIKEKAKINSTKEMGKVFKSIIIGLYNDQYLIRDNIWIGRNWLVRPCGDMHLGQSHYLTEQHKEMLELLVHQLVFDILYEKHFNESPKMTLNQYCEQYIDFNWDNSIYSNAIQKLKIDFPQNEKILLISKLDPPADLSYIEEIRDELVRGKYTIKNINVSEDGRIANIKALVEYAKKLAIEPRDYSWALLHEIKRAKDKSIKAMRSEITKEVNINNNPEMRKDIAEFRIDPATYLERLGSVNKRYKTEKTRYKHEWDYLYYNHHLITSRQYNRKFGIDREKRSYYYGDFVKDFEAYDHFVKRILPRDNDDATEYFRRSMDYYHLERYKRLDYIYKLAVMMESYKITEIDKNHFSVKRFHPYVYRPLVEADNTRLFYADRLRYYLPLLFVEEAMLQKRPPNSQALFGEFNIVRAKAYELFKYNFHFDSDDYPDMTDFISTHYNLSRYHVQNKQWYNPEKKSREQTIRIQNADIINKILFGESAKRIPFVWENPNK